MKLKNSLKTNLATGAKKPLMSLPLKLFFNTSVGKLHFHLNCV